MKILICGSRDITDKEKQLIEGHILKIFKENYKTEKEKKAITILNGYAKGTDMVAYRMASEFGLKIEIFKPDYLSYGTKLAPIIRDDIMVNLSDKVYCFWDQVSEGTKHVRDYAKKQSKPVKVYNISPQQSTIVLPNG